MGIPALETRIRLIAVAATALLVGAVMCLFWPIRHAGSPNPAGDSGAAKLMRSQLNSISLAMLGYVNDHDSQYLETVKEESQEINRLLRQYQQDQPASAAKDVDRMETSYQNLHDSVHSLLKAEQSKAEALGRLSHSREMLISLLSDQMEPAIHPNQLNATQKLRAVLEAASEAKGLAMNHNGQVTADPKKFHLAIDRYQRFSRSRRADAWGDEALALFDRSMAQVHDISTVESARKSFLQGYFQAYQELAQDLGEATDAAPPWPAMLRWWLLSASLVVLFMTLMVWGVGVLRVNLFRPLADLISAAEAAAAGDLTRVPEAWSHDEVGQLAQAMNRLVGVLGRSENLVYHLATLIDSTGEAIISQTLEGTILSWNKGAQRLYGYSADEVKGRSIAVLTPQDGGESMMQLLGRIREGERIQPFEMIHEGKNGRVVHVFLRATCILDSTKKVIGASLCAQDISGAPMLPPQGKSSSRKAKQPTEL